MNPYGVNAIRSVTVTVVTLIMLFAAASASAAPVRVAILPFNMNAEKDLTYLQEGVLDMLASRLAQRDKVEIVNKHETKTALESVEGFEGESLALLVGGKVQADYVLFGSLTVFGESVSIDAKMVDVSGQHPPLPFYAQTASMGEVIPQINQFATNINATVFDRGATQQPMAAAPTAPAAPAPQAMPLPSAPAAQQAPAGDDPRMHPEKMLEAGMQADSSQPPAAPAGEAPNPAFVPAAPAATEVSFWKSRNIKSLVTGVEVADVDADGRKEIVVVSDSLVSIFRIENGRMIKAADAAQSSRSTFISADAADINGNGTPEIYVTSLGSKRTTVDSFVVEYTGGTYATIAKGDNWFYRTARTPDHGTLLLGQRQRLGESSIFNGPINEMRWEGDRLVPGRQVLPGRLANLMGLAYGDITHTGTSVVAAYSNQDRVRIYSGSGDKTWEAAERSGGDMLFFNLPKTSAGQPNKQFLPLRIRITDIDRDGKVELMIAHHDELANSMLQSFRNFKNAKIASVEWDGLGLAPKWETQQLSGRISDFAVGDVDNDGADELLIALVVKEGAAIFTDSISSLIAFDLNP